MDLNKLVLPSTSVDKIPFNFIECDTPIAVLPCATVVTLYKNFLKFKSVNKALECGH